MIPILVGLLYFSIATKLLPGAYRKWRMYQLLKCPRRVIVFTRYPTPGTTKTRLIPCLGDVGAAALQTLMTNRMLDTLSLCAKQLKNLCVEVRYYGGSHDDMEAWLGRRRPSVVCRQQQGGDLGARMANALVDAFNEGTKAAVVVGCDIPGINEELVMEAIRLLEGGVDVTLGPAHDGGYYTVGASYRIREQIGRMFEGIEWGTGTVLQQQVSVIESLNISYQLLSTTLHDVDLPGDLEHVEGTLGVSKDDLLYPQWSVIIPILNEARNLEKLIKNLIKSADAPERLEVIIVDGGSSDDPLAVVERVKHELQGQYYNINIELVNSPKGRGVQLNKGASLSHHKLLLFLHADSVVPCHYDTIAWSTLIKPGVVGGAYTFGLDILHDDKKRYYDDHAELGVSWWFMQQMRLLEWGTLRRSTAFELPYGDQGLFLWRDTFNKVGGYPPYRLMEDYEMISRLKKLGHIAIADGSHLLTSARRWQKHGYFKITGMNTLIILAYKCGISPETLATWYYGK